ncbi:hypothetical protein ACTXG7_17790 [Mycolicibacterium sp. Dal123E01]|uniref:hypothetical protein n=1 Tax=Mycolicibacterium sp. Dal123E01 TaxID=3457578 RepID=UPI00403E37ED
MGNYERIGRVGGLAVALGIGAALASAAGTACAEPTAGGSDNAAGSPARQNSSTHSEKSTRTQAGQQLDASRSRADTQRIARATPALEPATTTNNSLDAAATWAMLATARRKTDAHSARTLTVSSGEVTTSLAAAATPKTMKFTTLSELSAATASGVIAPYHGGTEPWSSWDTIVNNSANWSYSQDPASPGGNLVEATVTYTYTSSIPGSQEFKNWFASTNYPSLGLHPADYSLWVVTARNDGSQTILGGTRLDVGNSFAITGMAWGGGPVYGPNANYIALIPSSIAPVFPRLDTSPPTSPFLTVSQVTATTVSLTATGGVDNVEVVGYNLYRDGVRLNVESLLSSGQVFTDTALLPTTTYVYQATAVDFAGNESSRTSLSVTTNLTPSDANPPTAPVVSSSTITPTSVKLTPSGGQDDVGVVGYNIYRDGNRTKVNDGLIPVGGSYIDFGLESDSIHYYYARAVDAAGNESLDSRSLRVNTLDAPARYNSAAETNWEIFNTTFGWIPIFGEGLSLVSAIIDSAQLAAAIADGNRDAILDEIKDLAGDFVGLIPFGRLVSEPTEGLIDILATLILGASG